jgi:hypothetical protein
MMAKPKYLYHGSAKKLEALEPQKPYFDLKENSMKAVFATDSKNYALGMAAMSSGKVSSFRNHKTHQMNIVEGKPNLKSIVYLYFLNPKDFKQNIKNEYVSLKKVLPVKIEKYNVFELKHLWRKSNKKELAEFLKDRENWIPKNES